MPAAQINIFTNTPSYLVYKHLAKISEKIYLVYKLFKNKFAVCVCSPTTWQFSQLPLAVLQVVLPHTCAGYSRGQLDLWLYCSIYISESLHPSIRCVTQEDFHVRTKAKSCFDIVLGICKSSSHVTGLPHSPYMLYNREHTAFQRKYTLLTDFAVVSIFS